MINEALVLGEARANADGVVPEPSRVDIPWRPHLFVKLEVVDAKGTQLVRSKGESIDGAVRALNSVLQKMSPELKIVNLKNIDDTICALNQVIQKINPEFNVEIVKKKNERNDGGET